MFDSISIRLKLALLAGVPVIGALILSALIASEAQRRAESAAALGSIEDLARLAGQMSTVAQELQDERVERALLLGSKEPEPARLHKEEQEADTSIKALNAFLAQRNLNALPAKLNRDLTQARKRLAELGAMREPGTELTAALDYYGQTIENLIGATTALTQLSDDGALLRKLTGLSQIMEVKERVSREHAVLAYAFAAHGFPPGVFRLLVTLVTEEDVHAQSLRLHSSDDLVASFSKIEEGESWKRAREIRKAALENMDDELPGDAIAWVSVQGEVVHELAGLERQANEGVKQIALSKMAEAQRSVRLSAELALGVLFVSVVLALLIRRGITRSVVSLTSAAARVRENQDYSVRAQKVSTDELGSLTDAFNEMLANIQARDKELEGHRTNLEQLVAQRTAALQRRNQEMRVVLDNVDQGLVTIETSGKLSSERSAAFDRWFGQPEPDTSFMSHLAQGDNTLEGILRIGWEQVAEDFLPLDVALDQLPKRVRIGERLFELGFRPILANGKIDGALLVVSDVTEEVQRALREAEQREFIAVFERVMKDRAGFLEFFEETGRLVSEVTDDEPPDVKLMMRLVHTIKGNCLLYGVESVGAVAHELESKLAEGTAAEPEELERLAQSWASFSERVRTLTGSSGEDVVELALHEYAALLRATRDKAPHTQIQTMLSTLRGERALVRLRRLGNQAKSLAQRLGKGDIDVSLEDGGVRLPPAAWGPFWSSMVHVIRNAVDHGIEPADRRAAAKKNSKAKLMLRSRVERDHLILEVGDDGKGVDWERVKAKARERGLPHDTQRDLVNALFSDGLSTRDQVDTTSGRGVGMSAVREACHDLGGEVDVWSEPGQGTIIRIDLPLPKPPRESLRAPS